MPREERCEFIRAKYLERKFAVKTCSDENDLLQDLGHAVMARHLYQLLQAFAEGAILTAVLPNYQRVDAPRIGQSTAMPQAPPPPPQNRKPVIPGLNAHGSMKKRAAPMPPQGGFPIGQGPSHSRTPSDPCFSQNALGTVHKRNPSMDLASSSSMDSSSEISSSNHSTLGSTAVANSSVDAVAPSNGRLGSDAGGPQSPEVAEPPVPPPRKVGHALVHLWYTGLCPRPSAAKSNDRVPAKTRRRCRALYDCCADQRDELSFAEGEIIVIISEITEDDQWMEGMIEGEPHRRGVFPTSFVHMLSDYACVICEVRGFDLAG
ncbi:development and differentiation-enhancing factor, ddef, putative [Ixodes scapularis]|uniref:Development and differentiation-enhancing factor, ddef, putative n=1 Tax=Ixodes scapularis TaxID=6945 RepID=B7Q4U0_IXOSC|nr:development and differentiation-enhancing factor, ddef, putative [Ixodes scapularis]|eukprot:XP_002401076.1 development and differentiation-enhancing factor, ddef, putative [Ixodes scapularis]